MPRTMPPPGPAGHAPGPGFADQPLAGCVVALTADRRRDDLAAMLRRRGARVLEAPTLKLVPLEDDTELRAATTACIAAPPHYAVATTGRGWRGWISAAEGWNQAAQLHDALSRAVVVSRGPKATGAVRASGLREQFAAESELCSEVLEWLLARDIAGKRVAVQQYGTADPTIDCDLAAELRAAGAEVIAVPVYRWDPPADRAAVGKLIDAIVRRDLHAVAFTSAPGATALLEAAAAGGEGMLDRLLDALRTDVAAACVGPVCARPLEARDVPTIRPDRSRLGALAAELCVALPARVRRTIPAEDGRELVIQGSAVLSDGRPVLLPPILAAVLAELARHPGRVVSRADLLRRAWGTRTAGPSAATRDEHVVEATIARLRTALGSDGDLIRTVTKRGYRLAVRPETAA
ncbi:MAG TPA: uroporphyrinogen-III synthase [Actinocrinis sp.]